MFPVRSISSSADGQFINKSQHGFGCTQKNNGDSYLATTHSAPQQCAKHIAVIILSQNVPFEGYHASAPGQLFVTNVCNATILPYISFPNSHSDTRHAAMVPPTNSIHVCEKSADTCSNVIGSREMFAIVFRVAPVFASQPTACLESRHLSCHSALTTCRTMAVSGSFAATLI